MHWDIVTDDKSLLTYDAGKLYVDISEYNPNHPDWGGNGMSPSTTYVFEEMFTLIPRA